MPILRLSHPSEAIPAARLFPTHHLASDPNLLYLGTHYHHDVYLDVSSDFTHQIGALYCVHGPLEHEYYSAVGYELTRTNPPTRLPSPPPTFALAAACALLNHPSHIPLVLSRHRS